MLTKVFLEEEIRDAIWECDGDKTPRPNEFNFNFLKKCWEVVKVDIVRATNEFHNNGRFPRGSNASFATLIP